MKTMAAMLNPVFPLVPIMAAPIARVTISVSLFFWALDAPSFTPLNATNTFGRIDFFSSKTDLTYSVKSS